MPAVRGLGLSVDEGVRLVWEHTVAQGHGAGEWGWGRRGLGTNMEMAMAMEKRRLDDNKSNLGGTEIGRAHV